MVIDAAPAAMPVFSICGFSGAGKTTLIEAVIPRLIEQGLRIAIIKHDAHGLLIDKPGKDSDRLFRAGADVIVHGPEQYLLRGHKTEYFDIVKIIDECRFFYDLVMVEGHKDTPFTKVWLDNSGVVEEPPQGTEHIIARFSRDEDRVTALLSLLADWLPGQVQKKPVYACILIGGKSRRMGQPKHLMRAASGASWLEEQVSLFEKKVDRVVIVGAGELPVTLSGLDHLSDVPGVQGPMAGMLAAMRWQPHVSWLMVACDMPHINTAAIVWLLSQRGMGISVVQACLLQGGEVDPLLACYEATAIAALEAMAVKGEYRPSRIGMYCTVAHPVVPDDLQLCWNNINCAADMIDN